jgi:hypothetical protein
MPATTPSPIVINLETARYHCHFPKCGGTCCKNGRPGLTASEADLIRKNLRKFLPLLKPEAARKIEKTGFLTQRMKEGRPTMAQFQSWCIFNHNGCVLQKVGMAEGEKWKYKPHLCVLFPLCFDERKKQWYVRQKGFRGEVWDVYCLERTPRETTPAKESLKDELAYLACFLKKNNDTYQS